MRIAPNESLYCSNFFVFLLDIRSELPFYCTNVLGCFAPRRVPIASRRPRLSLFHCWGTLCSSFPPWQCGCCCPASGGGCRSKRDAKFVQTKGILRTQPSCFPQIECHSEKIMQKSNMHLVLIAVMFIDKHRYHCFIFQTCASRTQ